MVDIGYYTVLHAQIKNRVRVLHILVMEIMLMVIALATVSGFLVLKILRDVIVRVYMSSRL